MAPEHTKAESQPQAPETEAEVKVEKPPVKPEEYLNKNIEFFKKYDDLKATKVFLKNGMASKETYQKAKQDYEKMRDEVSGMDLTTELPEGFSGLATREDFERKLAELQPEKKTDTPKIENINPKMEPYSGKLRAGMEVKYEGADYKLLGYDGETGRAILGKEGELPVTCISQEKLYAENAQTAEAQKGQEEVGKETGNVEAQTEKEGPPAEAANEKREAPPEEMTLDEIEAKIKFAKDTGRVPGIGPEGLSYWEGQKKLYLERRQAEETEKRAKELEELLKQKYAKLIEAIKQEKFAKDTARPLESAMWEEKRKNLQKEIDGLEKELGKLEENPDGKEWKRAVKNVYEKAKSKGKKVWGFLKERAKGFATFGLWELKEAEVFRRGTNKAEEEIKAVGQRIQEEEGLSPEEAQNEAKKLTEALGKTASREQYQELSEQITKKKRGENEKIEKEIIDRAVEQLEEKLESRPIIANYRSVHGGEKVLTQENVEALRAELAVELKKLRNGQIRKDRLNYATLMRKNLDPKWWARYIWGPAEMVLMGIGVKFILTKLLAEKATAVAGKTGTEQAMEIAFKDTVWAEAKRQLVSSGVANPTFAQIKEVAVPIAKESGIIVKEWGLTAGHVIDTQIPAGSIMLKLKGGLAAIAKIKSAMLAG